MARKFNFNIKQNEYKTYGGLSAELIDLYGFELTYIKTTLLGHDKVINDIQNFGTDKTLKIMAYPENAEQFDERGDILNKFGLFTMDSMNLFISAETVSRICNENEVPSMVGDLILLPSGKYLEITSIEHQVPGINNQFVKNYSKNVFLVRCKTYSYNHDEIPTQSDLDENITLNDKGLEQVFGIIGTDIDSPTEHGKETKETIRQKQEDSPLVKNVDAIFGYLDS